MYRGIAGHDYLLNGAPMDFTPPRALHVEMTLARTQVAVLQPFLKRASRRLPGSAEQLNATPTYSDAVSKLEEAVALVDTLGCEVVFKEVREKRRFCTLTAAFSFSYVF